MTEVVRILGIDPGLQCVGFGVIDSTGYQLHYVASGTITTTHLPRDDLPARLNVIFNGIAQVVERYGPQETAVEIVFVNMNPQASLLLGQARGACLTSLVQQDLPVAEYTALQMKKSHCWTRQSCQSAGARDGKAFAEVAGFTRTRCSRCFGLGDHACACTTKCNHARRRC
jgi:crossover junction endodeoxyribonuclease RuvC